MKRTELLLISIGFLLIVAVSEALYVLSNTERMAYSGINITKFLVSTGRVNSAIYFLHKTTSIIGNRRFPLLEPEDGKAVFKTNRDFEAKVKSYITDIKYEDINTKDDFNLASLYYNLSLLAYKNDQKALVPDLLKTSISLSPQVSYFEVELANYFLLEGNKEMSKRVLEMCQGFDFARAHCVEYFDNNYYSNQPEPVGFLKQQVLSFPNKQRSPF